MIRSFGVLLCSATFAFATARAQATPSPLKRSTPPAAPQRPACSPAGTPPSVTSDARRRARDLAQKGRQAAILGDSSAALAQLREASTVDPSDADLAYELARAYETAGSAANAAKEYCRFLGLSPNAPEANEARARVAALMPVLPQSTTPSVAGTLFNEGIASFEHGKPMEAEAKFAAAIKAEPSWADAYYNRSLARAAIGDQQQALTDLEEYLRLKPNAADRPQIVARIESLRRRPLSPGQALGIGLVLPGGGQFYTHRPVRGAIALVGASAALAFALQQSSKTITVQDTATDPFGNPYTFTTTRRTAERANLVPGGLVVGAIAIGSAVEAYMFARRNEAGAQRVSMTAVPTRRGFAARVSLLLR